MPFRGRKVADIYAELHLDRDDAKDALRRVPGELGPDADRAGRELGKKVTDGLARAVEQGAARVAKARRAEVDAANAVKVAELRLNEAREKGNRPASQMLALEQALERAQYRLAESNKAATTAVTKHADAERRLGESLRTIADRAGPDADRAGRDLGGKLSQGIHLSIVRNSPLIAAAIGGALAAGAPVALAGATSLFVGVGTAAQAQSVAVRSAWTDAWEGIKADAFDASTSLQPVLVGLAGRVELSFRQMAPALRETFEAAAPQVDVFATGILSLATNALPGLQRAVERGMPVTQGLANFLEDTGKGLTGFFDAMSEHSPAAGKAFDALGDIIAELLPTIGTLLGQGVELAQFVLPPLAKILGVVADVAEDLGPALPAISAGFLGMKIASSVADGVGSLGTKLSNLKSSITPANAALGVMGTVIGLTVAAMQESDAQTDKWAAALEEGGAAARQAAADMQVHEQAIEANSSGLTGFGQTLMGTAGFLSIYADDTKKAKEAADDWYKSLTPQARAAEDVKRATNDLADALDRYGPGSAEAEHASDLLTAAQGRQKRAQEQLELAIDGVTTSMIEQADQAFAAIDSTFALSHAQEGLETAMDTLNQMMEEGGHTSEELQYAQRDVAEAVYDAARAFGQQQADLSGATEGSAEYARIIQRETLAQLYELRDTAGPEIARSIDQQIAALERSGVSLNETGQDARDATLDLQDLGRQRPNPIASLNSIPFFGGAADVANKMAAINTLRASPLAWLFANTAGAEAQLNNAARNRTSYVTQYVQQVLSGIPLFHAAGGPIRAATGTKIQGRGGPTDDLVRAYVPGGQEYRVSPGEWIVNAMASSLNGDAKMRALNEGKARIILDGQRPRATGGGAAGADSGIGMKTDAAASKAWGVHVAGDLVLQIPGAYNLGSGTDKKRLLGEIRDGLATIDRGLS